MGNKGTVELTKQQKRTLVLNLINRCAGWDWVLVKGADKWIYWVTLNGLAIDVVKSTNLEHKNYYVHIFKDQEFIIIDDDENVVTLVNLIDKLIDRRSKDRFLTLLDRELGPF